MHTDIQRVETLGRKVLRDDYLVKNFPVIVTGHSAIREAAKRWSLDYLVAQHPDHKVSVEFYADGNRNQPWVYRSMTLGEYVSLIRKPGERARYYLAQKPLREVLPNLAQDVPPPDFLNQDEDKCDPVVFLGVDTYTGAHYHDAPREAVLMQIVGRKKVVLCPAEQYQRFYPCAWSSARPNWSEVPFKSPSGDTQDSEPGWTPQDANSRFPRLGEAMVAECVLAPGELLFIPQGWFHIVYGLGESISVTYFWRGSWRNGYWKIAVRDALSIVQKRYVLRLREMVARRARPKRRLTGSKN
jgi:hypothetical protein